MSLNLLKDNGAMQFLKLKWFSKYINEILPLHSVIYDIVSIV